MIFLSTNLFAQTKESVVVNLPGPERLSFLKLFGGINQGRPNGEDLKRATAFAEKLAALDDLTKEKISKKGELK